MIRLDIETWKREVHFLWTGVVRWYQRSRYGVEMIRNDSGTPRIPALLEQYVRSFLLGPSHGVVSPAVVNVVHVRAVIGRVRARHRIRYFGRGRSLPREFISTVSQSSYDRDCLHAGLRSYI